MPMPFDQQPRESAKAFAAFSLYLSYTVVLLACRDGDGNIFVVDEHAERLWLPQRHSAAIKAKIV